MNSLIELYDNMFKDPNCYKLMIDPAFKAQAAKIALDATSDQLIEFDEYVTTHLRFQFEKLRQLGEQNERE